MPSDPEAERQQDGIQRFEHVSVDMDIEAQSAQATKSLFVAQGSCYPVISSV